MSDDHSGTFSQAVAAHREKDHARAVEFCDILLARGEARPEILNLKAVAQAEGGQLVAARQSITLALESTDLDTGDDVRSILHVHAARIDAELDLYEKAYEHARIAAELDPENVSCLYQQARLALLTENHQEARNLVDLCTSSFPGFTDARILECQIAIETGELESAEALLCDLVKREPDHAVAWSWLADLRRSGLEDEEVHQALLAIRDSGLETQQADGDWATANFALAKMHARCDKHVAAFSFCREANDYLLQRSTWDIESWESRVAQTLVRAAALEPVAAGRQAPEPIFIVGMPRSGSSLLEQIFGAHAQVSTGGERAALSHIEQYLSSSGIAEAATGLGLDDDVAGSMRKLYRAGVSMEKKSNWVTDKAPRNFERIGLAMRIFPNAKVVWIVRHPLDTILSCYFQDFQHGLGFAHSLDHLARMFMGQLRLMRKWSECFAGDIHRVDYEELVKDPECVVRELCTFLGLEFDASMLRPHEQPGSSRTASVLQVQRPINADGVERWLDYREELDDAAQYLRRHAVLTPDLRMARIADSQGAG